MSARTLMRLLGHSDFATTLKYLEAADVRSDSMRTAVNLSFQSLSSLHQPQSGRPYGG